jgi:hypothetical protein
MTILLTAVGPMDAQAQSASARVSKGDAQKVVTIISAFCRGLSFWGDKAKTQTIMEKLALQLEERSMSCPRKLKHWEKRARSRISSTLLDGFEDIAKDAQLGEELVSAVSALVRLCTK